jgi:hypothetical protein
MSVGKAPKIFGIGLAKTGTTSLRAALTQLGLHVLHTPLDGRTISQLQEGDYRLHWLDDHDGATDGLAAFFAQLDQVWPGSRFILTVRDKEEWLASAERWFSRIKVRDLRDPRFFLRAATYGCTAFDRGRFSYVYERQHQSVRQYF